ncbi:hypothetical protein BS47DRAFT_1352682, partial [Hydnum rufescens UP504]
MLTLGAEGAVRWVSFILNWSGNTSIRLRATKRAILEPEENKLVLESMIGEIPI